MKSLKKLISLTLVIMMLASVVTIASGSISAATGDVETEASYYLVGHFDGVDIGGNEDSANPGYAMVDGQVTVSVKNMAYVCVKNNDSLWYMTDGWLGNNRTSATLYSTDDTSIARFDKLYVPKGTYTFTLTENSDGTVTLSYAPATSVPPVPAEGYSLIGQFDGVMVGDGENYASPGYAMDGGKVTLTIESVAYVCVKDNYSQWYMTDGWLGFNTTTATLYSTGNTSIGQFEKLYVPAGTYTFTLLENFDGTLTLSYAEAGDDPIDPSYEKGDVNLDGEVNILDATEIQKYIAQLTTLDEKGIALADTNGDEKVDIFDATNIQKFIAQLIPEL